MGDEATELGSWYDLVEENSPLEQGDILVNCPVFRPVADLTFPIDPKKENNIEGAEQPVIILSQSCDIKPEQKKTTVYVALCGITALSGTAYSTDLHNRLSLANGRIYGLHLLNKCPYPPWNGEQLIVSFRDLWTLPLRFLTRYAVVHGPRPRLMPPYREQLSQRFGAYFSRVATPQDLPRIDIPDKEIRTVDYLKNADSATRQRIFECFADQLPGRNQDSVDDSKQPSIWDKILRKLTRL